MTSLPTYQVDKETMSHFDENSTKTRKDFVRQTRKQYTRHRQSAKLFVQSSELGLPQPFTRRRVCPSPPGSGGGHTRWRETGSKSPNSNKGTYTVVLFIYMYFVIHAIN
jgi:hypothetical protein